MNHNIRLCSYVSNGKFHLREKEGRKQRSERESERNIDRARREREQRARARKLQQSAWIFINQFPCFTFVNVTCH